MLWILKKKRLNETVLLSTQNMFKLMGKKIFIILRSKMVLISPFVYQERNLHVIPVSQSSSIPITPRHNFSIFGEGEVMFAIRMGC